ncbi:unnamed protein product [Mytilus coruscus]|uniref:Uncharacterized protein n=1 Tax=Mytilus coruscus TaxID=42192 RepID=A0A6J8CTI1_MYTCO|nr:unnamed protein product [Mytilus coruscus]
MQETESSLQDNFSDEDEAPEIQVFSTDSKTISFLRFCGKCFGRGVDEKSGCYSSFRTHVENENEKVMFVDFRGNRFNIIFLMGQIAYYHHPRILYFFERVHGVKNTLHKLTLQLVKKTYIIACCKVLGLISKLITAPLWRLIESNKHVLHLNETYFALLQYLERMSKDANPFFSGEEYPFSDDLMEKDNIFDNLIQPVNGIDEKACAFAQMAFKGLHGVVERAMKEQLPGGKFFEPTQELFNQSKSVIPHNKLPERVFGMLDFFLRYRPNASTISNEAFLMFVFNKSSEWLETLPQEEREKLLNDSIKEGREIRVKYRKRLAEITEHRKQKLKDKQIALEKKQKAVLKAKSQHTNDIIYFGLWQNRDQVDTILEEIPGVSEKRKALISQIRFRQKVLKQSVNDEKIYHVTEKGKAHSIDKLKENVLKLIKDAGEGVGSERKSQNVPLFVGKRVVHTFEDGKWNGRVISVVQGFPDFYNIIYDKDVEDITTPTAIYTYKLKEDYRNGNLEIIPDVINQALEEKLLHVIHDYEYSDASEPSYELYSVKWNTLFIKAKCCGVGAFNIVSLNESIWYSSRRGSAANQQIPVQCCKSQTVLYPYTSREDKNCTYSLSPGSYYTQICFIMKNALSLCPSRRVSATEQLLVSNKETAQTSCKTTPKTDNKPPKKQNRDTVQKSNTEKESSVNKQECSNIENLSTEENFSHTMALQPMVSLADSTYFNQENVMPPNQKIYDGNNVTENVNLDKGQDNEAVSKGISLEGNTIPVHSEMKLRKKKKEKKEENTN